MTQLWPEFLFLLVVFLVATGIGLLLRRPRPTRPPAPAPGRATALFLYREGTTSLYGTVPDHHGRLPKTVIAPAPAGEGFRIGQLEPATVGRSHLVYREVKVYPFVIGTDRPPTLARPSVDIVLGGPVK